jgi:hypothetical protein
MANGGALEDMEPAQVSAEDMLAHDVPGAKAANGVAFRASRP